MRLAKTTARRRIAAPYASAPASAYRGIAPDARIVSIKVGVADGGVDVSQVIAAIDWVVQHRNTNGLNIRVINLSYGTNSLQDSAADPLSFAVEQAGRRGSSSSQPPATPATSAARERPASPIPPTTPT